MRLHVHNSLYLDEYDVAVQVLYRGRLTRPKLLTSLIEDIQRFGVRGHGGSNSKNDSARLSFDPNDELIWPYSHWRRRGTYAGSIWRVRQRVVVCPNLATDG